MNYIGGDLGVRVSLSGIVTEPYHLAVLWTKSNVTGCRSDYPSKQKGGGKGKGRRRSNAVGHYSDSQNGNSSSGLAQHGVRLRWN